MSYYYGLKEAWKSPEKSETWVALLYFDTMPFKSEVQNLLSTLEPRSTDSPGHQHRGKSVSTFKSAK